MVINTPSEKFYKGTVNRITWVVLSGVDTENCGGVNNIDNQHACMTICYLKVNCNKNALDLMKTMEYRLVQLYVSFKFWT